MRTECLADPDLDFEIVRIVWKDGRRQKVRADKVKQYTGDRLSMNKIRRLEMHPLMLLALDEHATAAEIGRLARGEPLDPEEGQ